jgi:predicted GNAT family N-acyltransferase
LSVVIRRLEQDDVVQEFDCKDHALNNYLKKHAWDNQQKSSIGVTYVAVDEAAPRTVLGYFTLASASVPRDAVPKKHVRGLPPYEIPLVLLARLAVDHRFAGRSLGHALISEALRISLSVSEQVGCRGVVVEAYPTAIKWYARYGFVPLSETPGKRTQKMYLDIRTLRAATGAKP